MPLGFGISLQSRAILGLAGGLPGTYYDFTGASLPSPWDTLRRAGLGTRIDAAGQVGYGAHNLITQSVNLNAVPWQGDRVTVSSGTITYDGTGSSFAGLETAAFAYVVGLRYTLRWSLRSGTRDFCQLWFGGGANVATATRVVSGPGSIAAPGTNNIRVSSLTSSPTVVEVEWLEAIGSHATKLYPGNWTAQVVGDSIIASDPAIAAGSGPLTYVPTTSAAVYLTSSPTHSAAGAVLGLQVQGQTANLARATEDLTSADWTKNRGGWWNSVTIAPNAALGPFGQMTADIVTAPANGSHGVLQQWTVSPNTTYTLSAWVADIDHGDVSWLTSATADGSSPVTETAIAGVTAVLSRRSITITTGAGQTTLACGVGLNSTRASKSFVMTAVQLELGTVATSYTPNLGTGTALRTGDFAGGGLTGAALTALLPGTPEVLGAELVTNGDFSAGSTGWSAGAGWSVSGGQAVANTSGATALVQSSLGIVSGRTYRVRFNAAITSGNASCFLGGATAIANFASGSRDAYVVAGSANAAISFDALNALVATIDNVSVREVVTPAIPGPQLPFTIVLPFRKANNAAAVETLLGLCAGASAGTTNQLGIATQGTQAQLVHSGGSGALTGTLVLDGSTVNKVAVSVDPTWRGPELVTNGDNEAAVYSLPTPQNFQNISLARAVPPGGGFAGQQTSTTSASVPHVHSTINTVLQANKSYRISGRVYVPTGGVSLFKIFDVGDGSWFAPNISTKDAWVSFSVTRDAKASAWAIGFGNNSVDAITSGATAFWLDDLSIQEIGAMSISVNGSTPVETTGIAYTGGGTTAAILGARDSSGGQAAVGFTSPGIRVAAGQYITGSALQALST